MVTCRTNNNTNPSPFPVLCSSPQPSLSRRTHVASPTLVSLFFLSPFPFALAFLASLSFLLLLPRTALQSLQHSHVLFYNLPETRACECPTAQQHPNAYKPARSGVLFGDAVRPTPAHKRLVRVPPHERWGMVLTILRRSIRRRSACSRTLCYEYHATCASWGDFAVFAEPLLRLVLFSLFRGLQLPVARLFGPAPAPELEVMPSCGTRKSARECHVLLESARALIPFGLVSEPARGRCHACRNYR